jgi:hypothetical protein
MNWNKLISLGWILVCAFAILQLVAISLAR